ncbi:hypothetical protein [Azospirillum cavernae]|nr:hypothetical protein [Azospirillum cavernae]
MVGNMESGRRELAGLGDALTMAERGLDGQQSPAALMARLLRVARLYPKAVDETLMWQITDLVAGRDIADSFKLVVIRMGWASILQAEFKAHGLQVAGCPKIHRHARAA